MLKFIVKKLPMMVPMLLPINFIVYFGLQLMGINLTSLMVSPEMLSANKENAEALREFLGLNNPLIIQYFRQLGNCPHGDLGYSSDGSPIASVIAVRLPYIFELAGYSLVLSAVIGIRIGITSAVRRNGVVDYVGRVLAVLDQMISQLLVSIILTQVFAIKLDWSPSANRISPDATNAFVDAFEHLFLPALTLTTCMMTVLMCYVRSTMLDVPNSDYIKTARSEGVPGWKVYLKHDFRNAMKPVLVILVFRVPMLVNGSVVIKSVFSYLGIGPTTTNAIVSADYPIVLTAILIIAATMFICSFMMDVFNALLDLRVRSGG